MWCCSQNAPLVGSACACFVCVSGSMFLLCWLLFVLCGPISLGGVVLSVFLGFACLLWSCFLRDSSATPPQLLRNFSASCLCLSCVVTVRWILFVFLLLGAGFFGVDFVFCVCGVVFGQGFAAIVFCALWGLVLWGSFIFHGYTCCWCCSPPRLLRNSSATLPRLKQFVLTLALSTHHALSMVRLVD